MMDYERVPYFTLSSIDHLRDEGANYSADESVLPASTLSLHSEGDSSSDVTSYFVTARSASPVSFLEENDLQLSLYCKDESKPEQLNSWSSSSLFRSLDNEQSTSFYDSYRSPIGISSNVDCNIGDDGRDWHLLDASISQFTPIKSESTHPRRSRTLSPGMSKMLLSLSAHPLERPCTPTASSLYRDTRTHCNPSQLGRCTYDECMFFTEWANKFLQYSRDHRMITDLARDLGDGLTLLSLVELLIGKCPPQLHIKPALDVQKMENIQACLDFLEQVGVSVHGIAAEDIVQGNLKVVLALCHCLRRIFGSISGHVPLSKRSLEDFCTTLESTPMSSSADVAIRPRMQPQAKNQAGEKLSLYHAVNKDDLSLFNWVSKLVGRQVTNYDSFQDGMVLCTLLNKVSVGVIPDLVLKLGTPAEKINLALKVSSEEWGIGRDLVPSDVLEQRNLGKFTTFLKSLYHVHSKKLNRINEAFERSNFRREMKREKLREQRLQERPGSQLTYLGDLSPSKPQFDKERKRLPLDVSMTMSSSESLTKTKDQLEDLKKELELLKLEVGDYYSQGDTLSQQASPQLSRPNDVLMRRDFAGMQVKESRSWETPRQVNNLTSLKESRLFLGEIDEDVDRNTHSKDLSFGGCYLSDPKDTLRDGRSFDEWYSTEPCTSLRGRDLSSSLRQQTPSNGKLHQPSAFYAGNMTFPPYGPSKVSLHSDAVDSGVFLLNNSTTTKGSQDPTRNRELLSLRRTLLSGNHSRFGNGPRLDSLSSSRPGGKSSIATFPFLLTHSPGRSKHERLIDSSSKSRGNLSPTNLLGERNDNSLLRSQELRTQKMDLNGVHAFQRSPSEEKRFREQIKAVKSSRNVKQGMSPKTHMQALTALARMSAKKASALCGEGVNPAS